MSENMLYVFGKGFQYSKDGKGNRFVLHLQGCNMHCPWCANPEGISPEPVIMQKADKIPEWVCRDFRRSDCRLCRNKTCVLKPNSFLVPSSRCFDVDFLFREAASARELMFGGGGVTLTGGEVCMQKSGAAKLLSMLKNAGINTAVESNLSMEGFEDLLPFLDYVIADYKHYNAENLKNVTGGRLCVTESNIRRILDSGVPLLLRIPLVHGFNDSPCAPEHFAEALRGFLKFGDFSVELLPYHEFGRDKWKQCGMEYKITNGFVSDKFMESMKDGLKEFNIINT